MNELSWLLYLAGVSENLSSSINLLCILLGICIGVVTLGCMIMAGDGDSDSKEWFLNWKKIQKVLIPSFLFLLLVGSLLPSKDTVYAIAASETVEKAAVSPLGQKAYKALDAWLTKQTKGN